MCRSAQDSRGAVLYLFLVAIVAILSVASFVIDQERALLVHRNSEALADAVALASVQALDRSVSGWQNSKRMMLRILQESTSPGLSSSNFTSLDGFLSGSDPYDSEDFSGSEVKISEELKVRINRGIYEKDSGFISLENKPTLWGMPSFYLANAVHVQVVRSSLDTPLAEVSTLLGNTGDHEDFSKIEAEAYAIRERDSSLPVAPIAIPACYLFADVNPYNEQRYNKSAFDSGVIDTSKQCNREVIARGIGVHESSDQSIQDGILRSNVIPRPPLFPYDDVAASLQASLAEGSNNLCFSDPVAGLHENCKAPPIRAFLGMPGEDHSAIDETDLLIRAFADASQGSLNASVGTPFRAADSNFYLNSKFEDFLLELLKANPGIPANSPSDITLVGTENLKTFRDVFYELDPQTGLEIPALNFPARRNIVSVDVSDGHSPNLYTDPFAEVRLSWPTKDGQEAILLDPALDTTDPIYPSSGRYHFRYTNPMCHTPGVPHDDDLISYAREFNIMVIAPKNQDDGSGKPYSYCDLDSMFTHAEQNAVPPMPISEPVIVGFVTSYFFDFRVTPYEGSMEPTPKYTENIGSPAAAMIGDLVDNNPFAYDSLQKTSVMEDLLQEAKDYFVDQSEYLKCTSCKSSQAVLDSLPAMCDAYRSGKEIDCNKFSPQEPPAISISDEEGDTPDWVEQCFADPANLDDLIDNLSEVNPYVPESIATIMERGTKNDLFCRITENSAAKYSNYLESSPSLDIHEFGNTVQQSCVPSCIEICGGNNPFSYISRGWTNNRVIDADSMSSYLEFLTSEVKRLSAISEDKRGSPSNYQSMAWELELRTRELQVYTKFASGEHWSQLQQDDPRLNETEQCASRLFSEDSEHTFCGMDFIHRTRQGGYIEVIRPPLNVSTISQSAYDYFKQGRYEFDLIAESNCKLACSRRGAPESCMSTCSGGYERMVQGIDDSRYQALVKRLEQIDSMKRKAEKFFEKMALRYGFGKERLLEDVSLSPAVSGLHCLPRKIADHFDPRNPASWEQPQPRKAGYGCAGLRLRLGCEQTSIIPARYARDPNPALVGVD